MKRFLFTLLAVLAVTACRNAEMDTLSNPAETGVRIIVGRGERTVTPDATGLYYTLELTATDKEPLHAVIAESETSTTVNLTPGTWRLDIEGYLNADAAADESVQPVVQGAVSNIAVTGGVMTNVTVALETTTQADDGTGIFEYTVSFPDSVNSAELTITRYGEDQGQTFNLKDGGGGPKTVELAAGYYRIAVALDYGEKQVRQRDIVHIVNKLTTTASYTYTVDNFAEPTEESEEDDEPISIGVNITKSIGWFNVAAIEWDTLNIADSYEVYYKKTSDSVYTKADDPLIRNYGSYYRADVMGIAAGSYNIKVRPVLQETAEGFIAIDEERIVSVESHDRSGYAFANGKVPGAYKLDGTPKDNARVIYVTNANKDTVALDVNVDGKGDKTQTGLQTIIDGHKKGNETRPLIIRLIGQIKTGDWTSSYAGDMMFETKNDADTYITLEGVGDDATADGWGVRMKNASNIEISNIGFMNTEASEGDDVGLQQKNYYIWVHNCDLFYGKAGGDKDQAKGDGSMDSKGSTYVTFSYNHFWDNGKTHLVGNKESGPDGGPGLLSLHHNWYDHSDSRHPRVRVHTVHVYNNYYDGVAKYGIGATYGGSVFAEGNYFRGTKKPMLISMQGSDIWDTASGGNKADNGTFSGEDGGIIKAYGNYFEGSPSGFRFVPYGDSSYPNPTVDFDAYVVTNRNDTVPDTVKTSQGSQVYNNFDTAAGFYTYTADTAEAAKAKVKQYAGRMGGGDFKWTFTTADDASYDVNTALQSALTSYTTSLVSAQGSGGGENTGGDIEGEPDEGNDDEGGDEGNGEGGGVSGDSVTCDFTGKNPSNSAFTITSGSYSTAKDKGAPNLNGYTDNATVCLKMQGSTIISFTTNAAMTMTLYFSTKDEGNTIKIDDGNAQSIDNNGMLTISNLAAGTHTIKKGSSESNLFYIELTK